jgi:esterase
MRGAHRLGMLHHWTVTSSGAAPGRWVVIIHGILGCGGGWRTFARRLAEAEPGLGVLLMDLRHHGRTGPLDGEATVMACVRDLEALCESTSIAPSAVLGHSFGGKLALAWAQTTGRSFEEVWLLDSPPGVRSSDREGGSGGARAVARLLDAMKSVALPSASREAAIATLVENGLEPGIAQWAATNLRWDSDAAGYLWRVDFRAIDALLADYFALDGWEIMDAVTQRSTVHLVRGGASDRWTDAEWGRARRVGEAGSLHVHTVPDAGHWLHVDAPAGLCQVLGEGRFFSAPSAGPRMGDSTVHEAS